MPVLTPEVEEFLALPNIAALSTIRPDGRPHVTPVWYEYDGREFTVSALRTTRKVRNIQGKSFAALTIYTPGFPYKQVTVEGAARIGGPMDNVWRERVAMRYLGEAAGRAYVSDTIDLDNVAIGLRPVKWHIEGFGQPQ